MMTKWLKQVIACGIWHTWGSADMERYLNDRKALEYRLEDQYGLNRGEAISIADIIINNYKF